MITYKKELKETLIHEAMISKQAEAEMLIISMLEAIVLKQNEILKLMRNGKELPTITELERENYREYVRKRLG